MSRLIINNSFCQLQSFSTDILASVKTKLTYTNEEVIREKQMIYSQLQRAKSRRQGPLISILKERFKALGPDTVCWLDEYNRFPTGLLHLVRDLLGNYIQIDDRVKPESYQLFRWNNKPHDLRPYQKEAVDAFIGRARGVLQMAVGSGKTRIAAQIIKELGVNVLFVVPSSALLTQAYDVLENSFGLKNVQKVSTLDIKKNKKLKPIRIITIQSLGSLQKQGLAELLIDGIDLLVLDECHHSASESFTKLLPLFQGIYYRLGLSGTYLRNDSKTLDLWGVSGEVVYDYSASKATKEGYLTPVEFNIIKLKGKPSSNYQTEYKSNYGGLELLESITDIVQNRISDKDQILILVERKEGCGHLINEYFKEQGISCTYVTGDNSKQEVADAIEGFNDKKIRILLASMILGEGCDIRSTDHLIMSTGGKSEISKTQAVGRAVRLYPGKKIAYVWDFNFQYCKYLSRHINLRVETYEKQFAGKVNYYE